MKDGKVWLIYIGDDSRESRKYWFHDMVASDNDLNPVFSAERKWAMKLPNFDAAMAWREKLLGIGYAPHIVSVSERWMV